MNKIFSIPENLVFSPCKVDGAFWSQFHTLISRLGDPQGLVDLSTNYPEQYKALIGPLIQFVSVTEQELHEKGYLVEIDQERFNSESGSGK